VSAGVPVNIFYYFVCQMCDFLFININKRRGAWIASLKILKKKKMTSFFKIYILKT